MPIACERPSINLLGYKVAEPCAKAAVMDVVYQLRVEAEPRGARLCLVHFQELAELRSRGLVSRWDARAITR